MRRARAATGHKHEHSPNRAAALSDRHSTRITREGAHLVAGRWKADACAVPSGAAPRRRWRAALVEELPTTPEMAAATMLAAPSPGWDAGVRARGDPSPSRARISINEASVNRVRQGQRGGAGWHERLVGGARRRAGPCDARDQHGRRRRHPQQLPTAPVLQAASRQHCSLLRRCVRPVLETQPVCRPLLSCLRPPQPLSRVA